MDVIERKCDCGSKLMTMSYAGEIIMITCIRCDKSERLERRLKPRDNVIYSSTQESNINVHRE